MQGGTPPADAPPSLAEACVVALDESCDADTLLVTLAAAGAGGATGVLFQRVDIAPFTVAVDYRPVKAREGGASKRHRRPPTPNPSNPQADYAALRDGSLIELANLINWDAVHVHFVRAAVRDVHGLHALTAALTRDWATDIRAHQTARVLEGATPVAGFVRVGTAAVRGQRGDLLAGACEGGGAA